LIGDFDRTPRNVVMRDLLRREFLRPALYHPHNAIFNPAGVRVSIF
jgi:hypothetical protein